ncbi:MAG: hypothetical protein R2746_12890 [Acidimicrobiales bacterium]
MSSTATPRSSRSDQPGGTRVDGLPDHVVIRQLYLGCLSQASYLVGDTATGRAIAVDPRRDIEEILDGRRGGAHDRAGGGHHFHADFLSGHLELAAATGAAIGIGAAGAGRRVRPPLAARRRRDLARRGRGGGARDPRAHPESISLVVRPAAGADPVAVLTGDTLFIGDVGRPDLLVAANIPASELGAHLYRSVHRLLGLPDPTLVLPAHGAGSACGKALSTETVSTIGEQRRTNYALQPMDQDDFIALVTEGQPAAPAYFGHDVALNRADHALLDEHQASTSSPWPTSTPPRRAAPWWSTPERPRTSPPPTSPAR